jgi:hypothetical protein
MKEKKMTRREAMARLTKIVAMAAGLSTTQVRRLFGAEPKTTKQLKPLQKATPVQKATPIKKTPDIRKLQNVRASNTKVKILKVMLHNNRSVFESEFGRITPAYEVTDVQDIPPNYGRFITQLPQDFIQEGSFICPVHAAGAGVGSGIGQCNTGLICGENFYGEGMGSTSGECNYCSVDGCSGHLLCFPPYECGKVSCGTHLTSEIVFTPSFFNQYINDPYVQALFEEFNAPTSQALAQELRTMLQQSRQGLR